MIQFNALRVFLYSILIHSVTLITLINCATAHPNDAKTQFATEIIDMGRTQETIQGGLFLKQSVQDCLKPEALSRLIENLEVPMTNWNWNLQTHSTKEGITEFAYRIHRAENATPLRIEPEPQKDESVPIDTRLWSYWSIVKNAASAATSAAYATAATAGAHALDYLAERSLVGQLTVESWACPEPFSPNGYRLSVDLMNSDILIHHFVQRAWLLVCLKDQNKSSQTDELTIEFQMLASPGALFSHVELSQAQDFASRVSRAWLDALINAANFRQVQLIRQNCSKSDTE